MEKKHLYDWVITPVLAGTIAFGCSRCHLDQPHIHVEPEPLDRGAAPLSYTTTSNVFTHKVVGFSLDDLKG